MAEPLHGQPDGQDDIELVGISLLSMPHHPCCPVHTAGQARCTCRRDETFQAWQRIVARLQRLGGSTHTA